MSLFCKRVAVVAVTCFLLATPKAHCPAEYPPEITLSQPSETMAIQTVFRPGFNTTSIDTFYQIDLQRKLLNLADSVSLIISGVVDSMQERLVIDSTWYYDSTTDSTYLTGVDTTVEQTLSIRILKEFKGTISEKTFTFIDTVWYYPPPYWPITYIGLVDTPFVAFFNTFNGTLDSMQTGPVDGCFNEPSGFFVKNGRIYWMGWDANRMPGISVSLDAFFAGMPPGETSLPWVETDTSHQDLPFGYGQTEVRRTSPKEGAP